MSPARLDVSALYLTLDSQRQQRGLSWRQLAHEAGVGPSTLSRMANGSRPDVDSFASLVHWLGIPAEEFLRFPDDTGRAATTPDTVTQAVASLLRADKNLDPETAAAIDDILQAAMRLATRRPKD
jgi:transcriptional regulator with XRE-family HTH domain